MSIHAESKEKLIEYIDTVIVGIKEAREGLKEIYDGERYYQYELATIIEYDKILKKMREMLKLQDRSKKFFDKEFLSFFHKKVVNIEASDELNRIELLFFSDN